jgi:DNA-3-methyladenine glycosylase I
MQATGMVNDHLVSCFCHEACTGTRRVPRPKAK